MMYYINFRDLLIRVIFFFTARTLPRLGVNATENDIVDKLLLSHIPSLISHY